MKGLLPQEEDRESEEFRQRLSRRWRQSTLPAPFRTNPFGWIEVNDLTVQKRGGWWRWVLLAPAFFVGSLGGSYLALQPFVFMSNFIAPSTGVVQGILATTTHLVQAFALGFGGVWLTYKTAPWGKGHVAVAAAVAVGAFTVLSLVVGMSSNGVVEQYGSLLVAILAVMVTIGAGWYAVIMRNQ